MSLLKKLLLPTLIVLFPAVSLAGQPSFEAKVVLTLEHKQGMTTSKHVATDFNLEVIGPLDINNYIDNQGIQL